MSTRNIKYTAISYILYFFTTAILVLAGIIVYEIIGIAIAICISALINSIVTLILLKRQIDNSNKVRV